MSPESEKIVKALRAHAKFFDDCPYSHVSITLRASADHIERLEKEKAEAKRQGFAEGLEKAAQKCDQLDTHHENSAEYPAHVDIGCRLCAQQIRALEESHAE